MRDHVFGSVKGAKGPSTFQVFLGFVETSINDPPFGCRVYLAHIAYLRRKGQIDGLVTETAGLERKAGVARKFIEAVVAYMKKEGANEDAALKNSLFADQIDKAARQN